MNSINTTARVAGLLYLLASIPAAFSLEYIPSTIIVAGDTTATVNHILASEQLFRLGIISQLISQAGFILVALALYHLLKYINHHQAVLMVIFSLVGTPIAMLNELNNFAALQLLSGANYLSAFDANQLHAQVMVFLELHTAGIHIAEIFWGLWLFPLGYLVFKSGFLPRILGILDMIAGVGYLLEVVRFFLFPHLDGTIIQVMYFGELGLLLWLLIKGINVEQRETRALASTA